MLAYWAGTMVMDGMVDLACMTTVPKHDELNYIIVEKEQLVLLASKNTELARRIPSGTPISILEARNEKFVSNKHGHSVRTLQDSLFITNNIQPKIILETMSIEIEKKVALACDAVTICPLNYIENTDEMRSQAALYPLKNTDSLRHCYICHRKELYLTKYMKDFINILLEVENPFMKDHPLSKYQS
ncbi:MAG: LysR family transcriptional regulator substrate-binding protein [Clostridium sp.]|nr:LysR family transcriptional regulator substrate-binding protein [Clostridium sp.]